MLHCVDCIADDGLSPGRSASRLSQRQLDILVGEFGQNKGNDDHCGAKLQPRSIAVEVVYGQDEKRPVPQVERVGALAYFAHWAAGQELGDPARLRAGDNNQRSTTEGP